MANDTKDPTRETLLKAGGKLFAKNGFDGVTVRDIAQEAGVNVAAVSYHFEGKEGLYRAVIEEFAKEKHNHLKGLLSKPPQTVEEFRLMFRFLIYDFLTDVMQNPQHCQILMKEIDAGLPMAADIFEKTLLQNFKMITKFLEDAQEKGFVRKDTNSQLVALMIQGIVFHLQRVEGVRKKFFKESIQEDKSRQQAVDTVCSIIFDGMIDSKR